MAMDSSMFPFGYDFAPTDEELLIYYLFHKIVGDIVPSISLPVIDIYSHEPAMIWQQCGGMEDKDIYFFTTLKKKKSRIIRKVGLNGGTWSGESKGHKVFSSANNAPIGTIKRFHYETSGGVNANDDDCSWIMHEYTLDPTVLTNGFVHDSYVVCLIRKRILKKVRNTVSSTIQAPFVFNGPTTTQTDALYMDGVNKCPPAQMIESHDDIMFTNEFEEPLEELNAEHSDNIMFANELENQPEESNAEHSDHIMFANELENQLEELNAEHSDDIMFAKEIENQLEELNAEHYDDIMSANKFEKQPEELNAEHCHIEKDSSNDFECPLEQMMKLDDQSFENTMLVNEFEMQWDELNLEFPDLEINSSIDHSSQPVQIMELHDQLSSDDIIFASQLENQLEELNTDFPVLESIDHSSQPVPTMELHYQSSNDDTIPNEFNKQLATLNTEFPDIEKNSSNDHECSPAQIMESYVQYSNNDMLVPEGNEKELEQWNIFNREQSSNYNHQWH